MVAFHRPYKRLGVEKGDERRVARVDHGKRVVHLEGPDGDTVAWKPSEIGGRRGSAEVYRAETIELRAGDRIRWMHIGFGCGPCAFFQPPLGELGKEPVGGCAEFSGRFLKALPEFLVDTNVLVDSVGHGLCLRLHPEVPW